jgi:hypothetical protein
VIFEFGIVPQRKQRYAQAVRATWMHAHRQPLISDRKQLATDDRRQLLEALKAIDENRDPWMLAVTRDAVWSDRTYTWRARHGIVGVCRRKRVWAMCSALAAWIGD